MRHEGSVRRLLRKLRVNLRCHGAEESVLGRVECETGFENVRALFLQAKRVRRISARVDEEAWAPAARSAEQSQRMARRYGWQQARGLGHLARRAVLRLRDSR